VESKVRGRGRSLGQAQKLVPALVREEAGKVDCSCRAWGRAVQGSAVQCRAVQERKRSSRFVEIDCRAATLLAKYFCHFARAARTQDRQSGDRPSRERYLARVWVHVQDLQVEVSDL
jgi:hypothetical protein